MDQQALSRLVLAAVTADKPDEAITEAVQKIAAQTPKTPASELGDFVWDVYNAIFDVSAQLQKQSHLVDFLVQLRQTSVSGSDGQQLSYEGGKIWTDLPTFGWVARDLWNFDALATLPDGEMAKLERRSSLLAQLTARSHTARQDSKSNDPFDFALYGLWALRTAFEDATPDTPHAANAIKLAAPWITEAGTPLAELSRENEDVPQNSGAPGQIHTDKPWKGFNMDRWKLWKDGFTTAANKCATAEVTDLARTAAEAMEKLSA